MNLKNSSILVTGGANGIGLSIVKRLLEEGCTVAILDKDEEALKAIAHEHPEVFYSLCDLTQLDEVTNAVHSILKQVPTIHGLINNAGVIRNAPLVNLFSKDNKIDSIKIWHEVLATNLTSVFYVTTQVVEYMVSKRTKGVIVNICSIAANGNAGQTAYSAAKAGLIGMSKTWAKEFGPMGIRCIPISPGFIDTPSTRAVLNENIIDHITKSTSVRRLGEAHEIAAGVVFALENDYFTGNVLEINGGLVF